MKHLYAMVFGLALAPAAPCPCPEPTTYVVSDGWTVEQGEPTTGYRSIDCLAGDRMTGGGCYAAGAYAELIPGAGWPDDSFDRWHCAFNPLDNDDFVAHVYIVCLTQ